ncbi:TfoX/Sxy family DNA transformation protein [uncultured Neptuniibacter sp.]|uniref:TfoX/Sxy family DNA transformation protein n=1 Tax=uncultured Neptuniibacter sp. TaxID=502143 RepID=UPI00260852DB|nr:TfoX/Sxy family DNA transformation protein [uncultured Neptuniibacter sp.]
MRNIGPVSCRWLAQIEIYTLPELKAVGAVSAYKMIRAMRTERTSLNLLWALVGAIEDVDCRSLSADRKAELRQQLPGL